MMLFAQISGTLTVNIVIAILVFILTFTLITTESLPNSIAAMLGAFILLAGNILSQEEAIHSIDFDTVGLLCGMMITVAVMRKSGLFEFMAIKGIKLTGGNPWRILVALSIVTAVLSAFLDNVTTVLVIVPLTFAVADTIKIDPMPVLISEILFSNIGGTATLIGDPPNIMIGTATYLEFMDFVNNNLPVIVIISVVVLLLLRLIYYKKLTSEKVDKEKIYAFDEKRSIHNKKFFYSALIVFFLVIVAFITHHTHKISLGTLAMGGGFIMMMVTRQKPEDVLKEVEWPILFFFLGLFIIIGGLEKTGVEVTQGKAEPTTQFVLWISAIFSSFIDNIPYTATMISVIKESTQTLSGSVTPIWWALSLGACLGGNGTLIGASANIVVSGFTQKTAHPLNFKEFFKVGFPLMIVSVFIASIYLHIRYFLL